VRGARQADFIAGIATEPNPARRDLHRHELLSADRAAGVDIDDRDASDLQIVLGKEFVSVRHCRSKADLRAGGQRYLLGLAAMSRIDFFRSSFIFMSAAAIASLRTL
jgi:hypothetical protein